MQRADRWVTGFQKHRYGHALWHNKRSPSAHAYFLCLSPMGCPGLGLLEKKKKICQQSKVCEGQRYITCLHKNLNSDYICMWLDLPLLWSGLVVLWQHVHRVRLLTWGCHLPNVFLWQTATCRPTSSLIHSLKAWKHSYHMCDPRHSLQHKHKTKTKKRKRGSRCGENKSGRWSKTEGWVVRSEHELNT